ncbi:hypothetical protein HYV85_03055 [Candidatus Woesearchaeota archaeon]|nr:hypothetical protein [Candidatus Woesearchaeota archaeon]
MIPNRMGRKGGFGFGQLQTAVLVLAVAIITLKITGGTAYAADKIGEITGVCLANPRIGSFDAIPTNDTGGSDMEFRFTVRGCTRGTELLIYKSYEAAIEKKPAVVNYAKANLVFHAIKETESPGKKLADLLKSSRLVVVQCPKDGGGRACDEDNTGKYLPGQHLFHAVLKRDGKVIDVKEAKASFFTEEYVELLDSSVPSCKDCGVIGCKRKKFESLLEKKDKCSEGVKLLYKQSGGKVGVVEESCKYPAEPSDAGLLGSLMPNFQAAALQDAKLSGCSPAQVNAAHAQTALSTFYRLACEKGDGIGTLADLPEIGFKLGKKGLTVEQVKGMAVSELKDCAVKAEEGLKKLGWISAEASPKRSAAYNKTMDDYLDALQPGVGELSLKNDANGLLTVSWSVPAGILKVKEFRIGHVVTKASDPSDPAKVLSASFPVTKNPSVCNTQSRTCSFVVDLAKENVAGWHEFSVKAASKVANADGSEYLSNPAEAGRGLYNNRFIELYSRHPKGCKDDVNKCDVIKKKKEFIRASSGVKLALANPEVKRKLEAKCAYTESNGLDECTEPFAVDLLYREVIKAVWPASFVETIGGFPCKETDTLHGSVCKAKRELEGELLKKGWFRVVETSIVITPSNIGIQAFTVAAGSDGSIKADFVVSGDAAKIAGFVIEHRFNRLARDSQKEFVNLLPIEAASGDRKAVIGPFEPRFDGLHKFKLKALDELSIELGSSADIAVGIYGRDYLELYDGDADNCQGDGGCNVIGKKRDYLNREKKTAEELLGQNEKLKNDFAGFGCDVRRVGQCRPGGVHALFVEVLNKFYPNKDQQNELLSNCDIKNNPYKDICKARKNLAATLKNNGWVEITNRGQTKDALPTTKASISTIPEKPLPGEMFRLVVEAKSTHQIRWLKISASEWKTVPCDWLSSTCKREFAGLYFEPTPQPIKIAVVDVTEKVSELEPFTPTAGASCLETKKAGNKWIGCKSQYQEEVLFECNSDGSVTTLVSEKEDERKYMSLLCGGFVDYGGTAEGSQGNCIYSCKFDAECTAAGGSIAPFGCPGKSVGYSGVELKQVCCDTGLAQEANPKTVAVLTIITDVMNQNIKANSVGGFFFFFDFINPIKVFTEGAKAQKRQEVLDVMEKLLADAGQGTPLSTVVGTMGTLKKDSKQKDTYLEQKYESVSKQFYGYTAKLEVDAASSNKAVQEKAKAALAKLNPLIANFQLFILPQRELDELAIKHSTDKLVLEMARYDALSWTDDNRQLDVLDNIYFEVGKILESTEDDAIAIEMYTLVFENFPGSEHAQETTDRINELNSLGHKAKSLTKSIAVDVFGDPFFFVFGGPKSLVKGGLTAVKVLSKTPQVAKQAGKVSEPFLREALEGAGVKSKEILEKAPGILVKSGGAVTHELKELLAVVPRVIKSRMIKTSIDGEGRLFFETTAIKTGTKVRVPYLKNFKSAAALDAKKVDEVKSAYKQLMMEKGMFFANPDDQRLAIRLLQSGLNKDEAFKVVTKADKIADDDELLAKLVNNFLEPEYGIAQPRLAKMVLAAKATPASVDEALAIKRAATEVILKTGYKRSKFLVAKTPKGESVTAAVNSRLLKGDIAAVDSAGKKYADVMSKYPQLLDDAKDQGRVLELVQSDGLSADDIGELVIKRAAASSAVKQRFLDSHVSKIAPNLDKINDADNVLKADDFLAAIDKARIVRAKEWKEVNKLIKRGVRSQVDVKLNELLQEKLSRAALKGGNAPALEGSLSGGGLDLSKTFYGAYGPVSYGKGVEVVPQHVPSLFNRLAAIKTKASDFVVSAELTAAVTSAEAKLFIRTVHAHAVEYGAPIVKVTKEKGLKPLNAVVAFDIFKAKLVSTAGFAELDSIKGAAVPVLAANPDGSEELAFVVFEDGALPAELAPKTDVMFVPDGSASYCAYYDVLVDCIFDDEISRSSMPAPWLTDNMEKAVLVNLNMRNLEDFETPKDIWLKENVAPLAASIQVDDEVLSDDEADDALVKKADELVVKGGLAYDTAKGFREQGLTDDEVQGLLLAAKDISSFNELKGEPAEKLKAIAG